MCCGCVRRCDTDEPAVVVVVVVVLGGGNENCAPNSAAEQSVSESVYMTRGEHWNIIASLPLKPDFYSTCERLKSGKCPEGSRLNPGSLSCTLLCLFFFWHLNDSTETKSQSVPLHDAWNHVSLTEMMLNQNSRNNTIK